MKKITNLQLGTLSYFLSGALFPFICFNSLIYLAKQDSYISIIIGLGFGLIPLISFYYLFNYEPSLNIFDKNKKIFGRFGIIINIILVLLIFFMILCVFINLVTFIQNEYLDKTPILLISILFIIAILYTNYQGVNATLRASTIFFLLSIILFLTSIFGLLFKIDLSNFKPVLTHNYYQGSFSYLTYCILPYYLLLLIPKIRIVNNHKTAKILFIFYFINGFVQILITVSIIGIFGIKLANLYNYPEFQILKYVYLKGISSKINSILFINSILDILIFIIYGLQFCITGICTYIKKKKNTISIVLSIILLLLTEKLVKTNFINNISNKVLMHIIFYTLMIILIISILFTKQKVPSKKSKTNQTQ